MMQVLTALRKANISSWPDNKDTIPEGEAPEPTLPAAKTSRRSFPPSISVSNWKLHKHCLRHFLVIPYMQK